MLFWALIPFFPFFSPIFCLFSCFLIFFIFCSFFDFSMFFIFHFSEEKVSSFLFSCISFKSVLLMALASE